MTYPVHTLETIADAARLSPPARLCVIGDPVAHSLSPQMHNPALAACGLEATYVRLEVKSEDLPEAMKTIRALGFIGANVTIPHKFTAMASVDEVDPAARRLGAVNTVIFREDGSALGRNSDGPGFARTVREEFGADLRDLRVLLLGAGGGAGGAAAAQSALEGCRELILANRTESKAATVAESLRDLLPGDRCRSLAWTAENMIAVLPHVDLIVNGTSLGMSPEDPPLLPEGAIEAKHLVYDMVYKPFATPLIAAARKAGASAINGLPMLLWQGVYSFGWWFGREAPAGVMRAGLEEAASRAAL